MKLVLIVFLLLIQSSVFSQSAYTGQTVEDIFDIPENEINVGVASLVFAKEFYPNMNVDFFLYSFDYMALRFIEIFGKYETPDERVRALNTYFFKPGFWNDGITFSYDDDDLHVTKLSNRFINGYIATKKGSCITMPLLYIIIGERLGWPIYPVRSAKHFFARYIPKDAMMNFEQNIEATNGGSFISDQQYQIDVQIPEKAIINGVYLRTLTKKEYLASLLLINANQHLENNNIETAKEYLRIAIKYDSTFSMAYWNYAIIHFAEAKMLEEQLYSEQQAEIAFYKAQVQKSNFIPANEEPNQVTGRSLLEYMQVEIPEKATFESLRQESTKNKDKLPGTKIITIQSSNQNVELQSSLNRIEKKYKPDILKKLAVYQMYKNKAEELGIVKKFPLEFFIKQSESLKNYKGKGN